MLLLCHWRHLMLLNADGRKWAWQLRGGSDNTLHIAAHLKID